MSQQNKTPYVYTDEVLEEVWAARAAIHAETNGDPAALLKLLEGTKEKISNFRKTLKDHPVDASIAPLAHSQVK